MNTKYTAIIKQDGDWWIGWIEKLPGINGQWSGENAGSLTCKPEGSTGGSSANESAGCIGGSRPWV